jgi:hypothetical protein
MKDRLREILLDSDATLATFILGAALIVWGVTAVAVAPSDFFTFADSMHVGSMWFWFANYVLVGAGLILCAFYKFPPLPSLLIGGYAVLAWTWVASARGSANFTSGVTLNIIVIVMGCLIVQRSGRK